MEQAGANRVGQRPADRPGPRAGGRTGELATRRELVVLVALVVALVGAFVAYGTLGHGDTGCVTAAPADPLPRMRTPQTQAAPAAQLAAPEARTIARMLVSTAENDSLNWEDQYGYIAYDVEGNDEDNRGYTGGIIGFTSRTGDMLELVRRYTVEVPDNSLAPYLEALAAVDETPSAQGLGPDFESAWREAASDPLFQQAQRMFGDGIYFYPAVGQARLDGLGPLGQFIYYDAAVMHGPEGLARIRAAAQWAQPPARGGSEVAFLKAFLNEREEEMLAEVAHSNTSRVNTQQRRFLQEGNFELRMPLEWSVNDNDYRLVERSLLRHC